MRVRILKAITSATWSYRKGQEVALPDEQAAAWIQSGIAELVRSTEPEMATIRPRERAVRVRRPRKA